MKKTILFLGFILLFTLSFWSCEDGDDPDSRTAFISISHYYTGRRAPAWDVIQVPSIWTNGRISGSRIPDVDELEIAGKRFTAPEHFNDKYGYVSFSGQSRIWEDSIPEPKFDPVMVSLRTNLGNLEGFITVPDTLETLVIHAGDTIAAGTSVTLSWTGGNADFYHVYFFHDWMEDEGYWLGYSRDTIVTGLSVTFEGSRFTKDGMLSDFEITPVNGPVPVTGALPNMSGDGFGFIYLENTAIESDRTVVIGEGIIFPSFPKKSGAPPDPDERQQMREKNIRQQLDL
jgi:hypothetical protein